jgi:nucleotide-binding universal stress UspA family protein
MDVNRRNKILIPIDESVSYKKALSYIQYMLEGTNKEFELILLYVLPKAKYEEEKELRHIKDEDKLRRMQRMLYEMKHELIKAGFNPQKIKIKIDKGNFITAAEGILYHINHEGCGTVVIGRRGISKLEEFLYGSVSQKIVSEARNCTVWIVEPDILS